MSYSKTFNQATGFITDLLNDELSVVADVVGDLFDDVKDKLDTVLSQVDPFQLTVTGLLVEYEGFYNCSSSGTLEERRNRVIAAIRAKGGLNISHFHKIAEAFGYTIGSSGAKHLVITEGEYVPWRVGISRIGIDKIYPGTANQGTYTVIVTGTNVESDTDLQLRYDRQKCAGITFVYIND